MKCNAEKRVSVGGMVYILLEIERDGMETEWNEEEGYSLTEKKERRVTCKGSTSTVLRINNRGSSDPKPEYVTCTNHHQI